MNGMINHPNYTPSVVVWEAGWPAPKTPWLKPCLDNPICFLFWSWSVWGKKIAKAYIAHLVPQGSKNGATAVEVPCC